MILVDVMLGIPTVLLILVMLRLAYVAKGKMI